MTLARHYVRCQSRSTRRWRGLSTRRVGRIPRHGLRRPAADPGWTNRCERLVQDRQTGAVILDAKVDLALRRGDGGPEFSPCHARAIDEQVLSPLESVSRPPERGACACSSLTDGRNRLRDDTPGLAGCTSSGRCLAVAALAALSNRPICPPSDLSVGRESAPIACRHGAEKLDLSSGRCITLTMAQWSCIGWAHHAIRQAVVCAVGALEHSESRQ
jgi:hypothetical protein